MVNQLMKIKSFSPKLTLVQRLVAGYAAMAFFTAAAIAFAIFGLFSVHKIATEIARNDLAILNATSKLRETMQAQERYAAKYQILKSSEFTDMFRGRELEFLDLLQKLAKSRQQPDVAPLLKSYEEYRINADRLFSGKGNPEALKSSTAQVFNAIDLIYNNTKDQLRVKLEAADEKEKFTIAWTIALSFTGFALAMTVASLFIYNVSTAIRRLKTATHKIAEGDFDYDPKIKADDEIGELARDFINMAARLKVLEQMSLDASPLTRLPGNIAIEGILNKRLQEDVPFAVCYADLDNLKAYNDHYGYIKASEVIKKAGEIIYEAVKAKAEDSAFVGHIGGDDFVMVVAMENSVPVCEAVIKMFDEEIRNHYTPDDLARGAIDAVDRYGVPRTFPIMTISIAITICRKGEFDSAVAIAKAAAEIKDYVKSMPGSNYLINRRKVKR
ncbi:nucleotide cyclase, HAMP and GGDEF-related domain-containing [Geotalea daltonii FRC-32]|uniref:histidine kinase n=1 Tax=Geotalea daltonii (strain DSM 22248 / JCM 15807 / FRC-32) TaxID=316067 RepID=B9LZI3_GEODF|nr:HAMP domain-containing protein [Geotalea daltonii]ACM20736.1 nucleotide cyclase, HAMP and GGDEF-related domain-containing [Geotalea daltonii FRC-32]